MKKIQAGNEKFTFKDDGKAAGLWKSWVEKNDDPYGKCCVNVARRVMELLEDGNPFECHDIVCRADKDIGAGGITGFMAGCVAQMVSRCHKRGDEFLEQWNGETQAGKEGKAAAKKGQALNPALLCISKKT